jgi:hypothetical protein
MPTIPIGIALRTMPNRQIAETLYVTRQTVESQFGHV